jgi:EF hand domain-containing protein
MRLRDGLIPLTLAALVLGVPGTVLAKNTGKSKGHSKQAEKGRIVVDDDDDGRLRGGSRGRNTRFRGLDRNRDGVITRGEWRGNDVSFRNHDRNRDGIISGSEVRRGGWDDDDDDDLVWEGRDRRLGAIDRHRDGAISRRFSDLDRNRDGIIRRHEWEGDWGSFDRLDRNDDGVLSWNEYNRG